MTELRRRITLAALSLALLAAVLMVIPSRDEAGADIVTAGAAAPVDAEVTVSSEPRTTEPDATSTTSTTVAEISTTTTTEAAPPPSTTTAVERSGGTDDAAAPVAAPAPAPTAPPTTAAPVTTTTAPPPPPAPTGTPASIIREIFGPYSADAIVIARCESGLNPSATNPAGYYGLFQIGTGHASRFESVTGTAWSTGRHDARANTVYARWLFDNTGQNWSQWGCRHQL